jgi:cation diffusion facilitator CzcD-associated flavoprotein CzcO
MEHVDVLIVGAGLSGIGAAYHLQTRCPGRSYAILEGRERLGGTWDLFRYPGIRSDSDMYTLGFAFKPWTRPRAIADGPSILAYLRETAEEFGIQRHIRFRHRVERASWCSRDARWTVDAVRDGEPVRLTCSFLFLCSGYYDYERGYTPHFPDVERFRGELVHPQQWSPDVTYAGKRVVVIGSGATAVTLVPELAKAAAHVTMLQRSPTYMVAAPAEDAFAARLRRLLPERLAYAVVRWRKILLGTLFYQFCQRFPERARRLLIGGVRRALGEQVDVARHFTPSYDPWDQRLCLVPEGDLFAAIRGGRASVVTDRIEGFTERGIRLGSGETLEADLVVTATGLNLKALGGVALVVDGHPVDPADTVAYKGMMFSGVPNLALSMGYTNASWTLKCDLTCAYVCRLLEHMAKHGYSCCRPRLDERDLETRPMLDLTSGYVQRAVHRFPRQGTRSPWRLYQNYFLDMLALRFGRVDDGVMEFTGPPAETGRSAGSTAAGAAADAGGSAAAAGGRTSIGSGSSRAEGPRSCP